MQWQDPAAHTPSEVDASRGQLEQELKQARIKLTLSQAYHGVTTLGHTAFRDYGIDYWKLPEWNNTTLLEQATKAPLAEGQMLYLEWCRQAIHGINAAIRRSKMKLV
jgi:hypothetical protein